MCGIAGELRFSAGPGEADWPKISSLMARRGPDDEGIWKNDPNCTFVFRRLSIIDLSKNGHQPMLDATGRYVLVFNGEVYNFDELRQELETYGVHFRSHSDTEVVLYALIQWGQKALEKFNGMFALAFYDSQTKRLLIARDHAGIKPLYYLHTQDGVVFSSQYDQLLAHPLSRRSGVSMEALGLYLRLAFIPAPYAILNHSHMLEPGTWAVFTLEGKKETGAFFTFPSYRVPSLMGDEAIEAIDAALTAAVKRHLVSDVPVGGFLSGGIDSPLVMAKMRMLSNGIIHAFTLGTDGDITDESQDAISYAAEIGIEQTVWQFRPDEALSMIEDVVAACGEPFGDYSIFPTMMISRIAGREYKVMLSGDGGDELFWGYPNRAIKFIAAANDFRLPFMGRKIRFGAEKYLKLGDCNPLTRFKTLGDVQRKFHTHLPENILNDIFPTLPSWPVEFEKYDYNGWETDPSAQWQRWNEYVSHLTMVLLKVDRASMYHSLEVRVPLLDREVIEVASKVDWRSCLDMEKGIGKMPLRTILAKHIKQQTEQKRGFAIPMGQWLRTSLRDIFEEKVLKRDNFLGLEMDQKAMHNLFQLHDSGRIDYGWGLWPFLSLALWADRHATNY
ncbi:MAG: asparagine synthase (glutamine-hydrolyzing) [Desulfobacteraceae bacterium]|nr:MAG: asparagine synthase (glutamine-hydrolyzing) [Desulfobacteraceae bacterium]